MRLHVVWLPHTVTSKQYSHCAYTQKVLNFCKMMLSIWYEVYHYGGEGSTVECTEHIPIISHSEREDWFWIHHKNSFPNIEFNADMLYRKQANSYAIDAIEARIQPRDVICLIWGVCQKQIADAFPDHMTVEFGIWYEGTFAKFRVYESYAWMHYLYWKQGIEDGRYYDAVIPNYFDPMDFPYAEEKWDYVLYIGRFIPRKGISIAVEATKKAGARLVIAWQWAEKIGSSKIISNDLVVEGDHIEYVWAVWVEERWTLMSRAKAVIVPTMYLEPFWGVAVEAMMCGTPVITSDWGAFPETVVHGKTGYRCRTLEQFVRAINNVHTLSPRVCRDRARDNYWINRVKYMYDEYFQQIYWLRWEWRSADNKTREKLHSLNKFYPH